MIIELDLEVGEGNVERTILATLFHLFVEHQDKIAGDEKKKALDLFSRAQLGLCSWKEIEQQVDEPIEMLSLGANKLSLKKNIKELCVMIGGLIGEPIKWFVDKGQIMQLGIDGKIDFVKKLEYYQ